MPWVAICQRARPNAGRNLNQTYIRVVDSIRELQENAADFVTNNPAHPWADVTFSEYIVDLTEQEAADIRDGANPLFYDGRGNQPRWQNENIGSATVYAPGSFSDPTTAASGFTADLPLIDTRLIVRLYDGDPLAAGAHFGTMDLDEGSFAGERQIFLRLFQPNDTPSGTNAQNALTEIAGKLMIFDFAAGITTFGLRTNVVGTVVFPSNHQYRVIGPAGETQVTFRIFGRTLSAPSD